MQLLERLGKERVTAGLESERSHKTDKREAVDVAAPK